MNLYVINLDRVPERWEKMVCHFHAVGLAPIRFSAVDAWDRKALDRSHYAPHRGDRWELNDSLIACFESHRKVWQLVVDLELPCAAIFEDDVVLSEEMPAVLEALHQRAVDFDVVKLDTVRSISRLGPPAKLGDFDLRRIWINAPSAAAYVVSQSGARRLLDWSVEFCDHTDDFIFWQRPEWMVLQLFPAVAMQMAFLSEDERKGLCISDERVWGSERTSDIRINRKVSKGPPWFRLRKEILRLRRRIFWKSFGDRRLLAKGGFVGTCPFRAKMTDGSEPGVGSLHDAPSAEVVLPNP